MTVAIVGGGVAGASLAIALGRRGMAVDLFDAQTFPRDKPCGEGIMPAGVSALRRLGIADGAGGAEFQGVRYHTGSRVAVGRFPTSAEHGDRGRAQRRLVLDRCLFELAASTPGVTARQGVAVEAPAVENGRVVGVVVNGAAHRAALVVAADGAHSRMRHRLGLNLPVPRTRVGARRHYRLPGRAAP
ncbi:MAG TPA: FAD-dependent monooxygenase, partial [Gemmatimonadales bacterium]|nr:FAD-dependent monooxygenase [Gemmatimonadales bacterium]